MYFALAPIQWTLNFFPYLGTAPACRSHVPRSRSSPLLGLPQFPLTLTSRRAGYATSVFRHVWQHPAFRVRLVPGSCSEFHSTWVCVSISGVDIDIGRRKKSKAGRVCGAVAGASESWCSYTSSLASKLRVPLVFQSKSGQGPDPRFKRAGGIGFRAPAPAGLEFGPKPA